MAGDYKGGTEKMHHIGHSFVFKWRRGEMGRQKTCPMYMQATFVCGRMYIVSIGAALMVYGASLSWGK